MGKKGTQNENGYLNCPLAALTYGVRLTAMMTNKDNKNKKYHFPSSEPSSKRNESVGADSEVMDA